MPVIPAYQPGTIERRPIGVTPQVAPNTAEGGEAIAHALGQASQTASQAAQTAAQDQDRIDEAAVRALDAQGVAGENGLLWNPQTGYFRTTRGIDAMNGQAGVQQAITDNYNHLLDQAQTPGQRRLLTQLVQQRTAAATGRISEFASNETRTYQLGTYNARAEALATLAANQTSDPHAQAVSIETGAAIIREREGFAGHGVEEAMQAENEYRSGVYSVVLSDLIHSDPAAAQTFFETHRQNMTPTAIAQWSGQIEQQGAIVRGRDAARAALAVAGSDLSVVYAAGDAIHDPAEQASFRAEVDRADAQRHRVEQDGDRDALAQAMALVQAGTPVVQLPADLQRRIGPHLSELQSWEHLFQTGGVEDGSANFRRLMATSIDAPDAFRQITAGQLLQLGISPHDQVTLMNRLTELRNGNSLNTPADAAYRTAIARGEPILAAYGILPSGRTAQRYGQFQAFVYGELQRAAARHPNQPVSDAEVNQAITLAMVPDAGHHPTDRSATRFFENTYDHRTRPSLPEVQRADPQLALDADFVTRQAGHTNPTPAQVEDSLAFWQASGGRAMVPYAQIPENRRAIVEQRLARADPSHPPTHAEVEEAFTQAVLSLPRHSPVPAGTVPPPPSARTAAARPPAARGGQPSSVVVHLGPRAPARPAASPYAGRRPGGHDVAP